MAYSYYCAFGTPVAIARPFNTYGPRQSLRAVIPNIILQALSGSQDLSLGALTPTRDFNFVEDTVAGMIAVLDSPKSVGETINLGSGFEISIADTVKLVGDIMGMPLEVKTDLARLRPESSEVERLCADATKAKTLLGWQSQFSNKEGLREGLSRTIEWLRDPVNRNHYRDARRYTL